MTDFTDCLSSFLHALQQGAPLGAGDATPLQAVLHQAPHPLALLQAGFTHTHHRCQQPQEAFTTHCLRQQQQALLFQKKLKAATQKHQAELEEAERQKEDCVHFRYALPCINTPIVVLW